MTNPFMPDDEEDTDLEATPLQLDSDEPAPEAPAKVDVINSVLLPMDKIQQNEWNANEMDDKAFNRLVEEIQEVGMIDPIQVVALTDGTYRILGGAHRFMACQTLGLTEVPAVVLTDQKWHSEDLQKFVTLRLNSIRGKLNPKKMIALYEEMGQKYGEEQLQNLMGYTDQDQWAEIKKDIGKNIRKALPGNLGKKFDEVADEIKTVEDLSSVLNTLFTKYGSTLDQNFMVFTYGNLEHIYVSMDKETNKAARKIIKHCEDASLDINELLGKTIQQSAKELKELEANALPPAPDDDDESGIEPDDIDVSDDDTEV